MTLEEAAPCQASRPATELGEGQVIRYLRGFVTVIQVEKYITDCRHRLSRISVMDETPKGRTYVTGFNANDTVEVMPRPWRGAVTMSVSRVNRDGWAPDPIGRRDPRPPAPATPGPPPLRADQHIVIHTARTIRTPATPGPVR